MSDDEIGPKTCRECGYIRQQCECISFDFESITSYPNTSKLDPWQEATPEQVVEEIKDEIRARITALPKADFNACAEVVGAVLNEYIDRGVMLDDEHALTEAVADVLDGVSG